MVLRGEIFDVVVDIRKGSPTHGRWFGIAVSAERPHMLYIPVGFAHGFCVLSDTADVLYKVTQEYSPDLERGILWNDPQVGICWPINEPLVSVKDAELPLLKEADNDFVYQRECS
jgi:dTDP-4-dehydrorhamnose 3,5-epimerase